jgi:ribosomal protein L11
MFRLVVPAGEAKPGPALSPVLGQHQIKPAEFVAEFNRASAGYEPGTPLNVRVTRLGGTAFRLVVCPPTWTTRLSGVAGRLRRADLWFALGADPTPRAVRTALGTLKSVRIRLE